MDIKKEYRQEYYEKNKERIKENASWLKDRNNYVSDALDKLNHQPFSKRIDNLIAQRDALLDEIKQLKLKNQSNEML